MKNRIIYIVLLVLLFALLYSLDSNQPKGFHWSPTFDKYDKNPFGAYVFDELLLKSWEEGYSHSYKNFGRMLTEGTLTNQNVLIISQHLSMEKEEYDKMLNYAREGHTVMLLSEGFPAHIENDMHFQTRFNNWWYNLSLITSNTDTLKESREVMLCSPSFNQQTYAFPKLILSCFFDSIPENSRVLAVNGDQKAIAISCPVEKGAVIFCTNPMIFSNYCILSENGEFVWGVLSYLKGAPLLRTEYYEAGSDENQSPFRYLLSVPGLRWGLYIALLVLLLFLFFTAKRKQRSIPVIKEPENHLISFVKSLSALYLRKSDNNVILQKKYTSFAERLHKRYGIDIINKAHNERLFENISLKTGSKPEEIRSLFKQLELMDSDFTISDKTLMELVIQMDQMVKT